MFNASASKLNVVLVTQAMDMRKSIDGLAHHVAYYLDQQPCEDRLFVFS